MKEIKRQSQINKKEDPHPFEGKVRRLERKPSERLLKQKKSINLQDVFETSNVSSQSQQFSKQRFCIVSPQRSILDRSSCYILPESNKVISKIMTEKEISQKQSINSSSNISIFDGPSQKMPRVARIPCFKSESDILRQEIELQKYRKENNEMKKQICKLNAKIISLIEENNFYQSQFTAQAHTIISLKKSKQQLEAEIVSRQLQVQKIKDEQKCAMNLEKHYSILERLVNKLRFENEEQSRRIKWLQRQQRQNFEQLQFYRKRCVEVNKSMKKIKSMNNLGLVRNKQNKQTENTQKPNAYLTPRKISNSPDREILLQFSPE